MAVMYLCFSKNYSEAFYKIVKNANFIVLFSLDKLTEIVVRTPNNKSMICLGIFFV